MTIATGIDIESTGLDWLSGHRVIEVAFVSYEIETKAKLGELEMRFNPRRNIDAKAQAVHGISLEMLASEPLFEDKAEELARYIKRSDLIVAHNGMGFDVPFLWHEFRQAGITLPDIPVLDTMLDGLWACEDGKRPRLQELAFALGFAYDEEKAHSALYDTDLMMQCFFRAREKYNLFPLPAKLESHSHWGTW